MVNSELFPSVFDSILGSYEFLLKAKTQESTDICRLFIYYNANDIVDTGCSINNGDASLLDFGICLENIWPFLPKTINQRPNNDAYENDKRQTLTWKPFAVKIDFNDMK